MTRKLTTKEAVAARLFAHCLWGLRPPMVVFMCRLGAAGEAGDSMPAMVAASGMSVSACQDAGERLLKFGLVQRAAGLRRVKGSGRRAYRFTLTEAGQEILKGLDASKMR